MTDVWQSRVEYADDDPEDYTREVLRDDWC